MDNFSRSIALASLFQKSKFFGNRFGWWSRGRSLNTLDIKKRAKYTIRNEMRLNIINVLKMKDTNVSSKFKFWVRKTFCLVNIGSSELLYAKKQNLPLISHEEIYEKINECHTAVGHSGRDKTWSQVLISFSCS